MDERAARLTRGGALALSILRVRRWMDSPVKVEAQSSWSSKRAWDS